MAAVTVTVREGWAVYDGTRQRTAGEVLDVPADTAEQWERAGWVEPTPKTRRQRPRQDASAT